MHEAAKMCTSVNRQISVLASTRQANERYRPYNKIAAADKWICKLANDLASE